MNNKNKDSFIVSPLKGTLWCIILGLLCLALFPSVLLMTHRFLLASLIPCFLLLVSYLKGYRAIKVGLWDLPWFIFLVWCLASYYWSVNGSLMWFPFFAWLLLILTMLSWRPLMRCVSIQYFIQTFFAIFFIICLSYITYTFYSTSIRPKILGYNNNYITLFLLTLAPFFWWYPRDGIGINIIKLLSIVGFMYVLYESKAWGNSLIFGLMAIFATIHMWIRKDKKGRIVQKMIFTSCLVLGLSTFYFSNDLTLTHFGEIEDVRREYMMHNAWQLFKTYQWGGIGLGNWSNHAYSEIVEIGERVRLSQSFFDLKAHDLYGLIMSELGLIGILSYLLGLGGVVYVVVKQLSSLSGIALSAIYSMLVSLAGNFVYLSSFSYEGFFSGAQYLTFISMAVFLPVGVNQSAKSISLRFLMPFSFVPIIWFGCYGLSDIKFRKAIGEEISPKTSNDILLSIYNPVFKTTHGFKTSGSNLSLDLMLANNYFKTHQLDSAFYYIQKGLKRFPNDPDVIFPFAKYLNCQGMEVENPFDYLESYKQRNKNNVFIHIILTKFWIDQGLLDRASHYFTDDSFGFPHYAYFKFQYLKFIRANSVSVFRDIEESKLKIIETYLSSKKTTIDRIEKSLCESSDWSNSLVEVTKEIDSIYQAMDVFLVDNLDQSQMFNYLNLYSQRLYTYRMWELNMVVKDLSDEQIAMISASMKEHFVYEKYLYLRRSSKQVSQEVKDLEYQEIVKNRWDMAGFYCTVLSDEQYQTFEEYKNKSKFVMANN